MGDVIKLEHGSKELVYCCANAVMEIYETELIDVDCAVLQKVERIWRCGGCGHLAVQSEEGFLKWFRLSV